MILYRLGQIFNGFKMNDYWNGFFHGVLATALLVLIIILGLRVC